MQFKALIEGLCERLGVEYAEKEFAEGEFELNADQTLVKFQVRGQLLQLVTVLRSVPESEPAKKKLYHGLLTNAGAGTLNFGSSIALDQDTNQLLIYQRFQMHALSILELEQALENFLSSVDHYNTAI